MKKYLIGMDIGTSGTKSALFDLDGNVILSETAEYPLYQPKNGYAEQDPEDWWQAAKKTLKIITENADGDIVGIGITGQMHSLVMLDENNKVIRPAILWCDQRTAEECREIEEIIGRERLIEITANPALPGFTASKLMWVKKHEKENFDKCAHILLAKDYIRFKLTGEYATEVSDASGMQLLDIKTRKWSQEVCEKLGIDMNKLAKVYESPEITGKVSKEAAGITGLPEGCVVAGGAGDNAAAAIGTGVYKEGKAFTTIGTSGVVFAPTNRPVIDPQGRIHTFCAACPDTWHVMGVTQAAGLSLNWFKNNLAENVSYKDIDKKCESIQIGCDGLVYLPYLMGERTPILDSDARGVFFGLSAKHTKFHMARAVMEGVSYSLYSCLEILNEVGIDTEDMALCGGGGKSEFWQKMLADVYMIPIKTMESGEGAALGAAILGGVAAGEFSSVADGCEKCVRTKRTVEPVIRDGEEYRKYYKIYSSLYPALKDECPLRSDIVESGFDIMIVRELTGGIYFGERGYRQGRYGEEAYDTEAYSVLEIERIVRVAFESARKRSKRLVSIDKANVLETSRLWRKIVSEIAKEYPDVTYSNMLVDNAAMQLVRNPSQFDVIVTTNMFGDILSDEASQITGSIGMLPSASINDSTRGLYEPIHGSAPDIAGQNKANPIATILSAAMMLLYSFGLSDESDAIVNAVDKVLSLGYRTADLSHGGEYLSTTEITDKIIENL